MTDRKEESHTVSIDAEIWIKTPLEEEWDREVNIVVTSEFVPSNIQAIRMIRALYPSREVGIVKVKEI